jgi:hypothetical protein
MSQQDHDAAVLTGPSLEGTGYQGKQVNDQQLFPVDSTVPCSAELHCSSCKLIDGAVSGSCQ